MTYQIQKMALRLYCHWTDSGLRRVANLSTWSLNQKLPLQSCKDKLCLRGRILSDRNIIDEELLSVTQVKLNT